MTLLHICMMMQKGPLAKKVEILHIVVQFALLLHV